MAFLEGRFLRARGHQILYLMYCQNNYRIKAKYNLKVREYWKILELGQCSVLCLVAQSCLTLCDPMDCSLPGSSIHGNSPGKNTGVGCHALLQGIFPTQGLNPGLPHCRRILYRLSHQGSKPK